MKKFFLLTFYLLCISYLFSQGLSDSTANHVLSILDTKTKKSINAGKDVFFFWHKQFEKEAISQKNLTYLAKANRYKGFYFDKKNKRDSAFFYYLKALNQYKELNDSFQISKHLLRIGVLTKNIGVYKKSEAYTYDAMMYLSANDYQQTASAYNNLGLIYDNTKQYDEAIKYHLKAYEIRKNHLSNLHIVGSLNNLGKSHKNMGNHVMAVNYFQKALEYKDVVEKEPRLKAMLVDNLAHTQFLSGNEDGVLHNLMTALDIREQTNNKDGKIISFLHLAEYYQRNGDNSKALGYAQKAEVLAKEINNYRDLLKSMDLLVNLQPPQLAVAYHNKYVKIRDSILLEDRNMQHNFDHIEFFVNEAKKELEMNRAKLKFSKNLLYSMIGFGMMTLLIFIGYTFRRKQKQKLVHQQFADGLDNYLTQKYGLTPENLDFWLIYIQGKDQYEMADELSISVDGVKSRRKSLRNKINKVEKIDGKFDKAYAINLYNQEKELFKQSS